MKLSNAFFLSVLFVFTHTSAVSAREIKSSRRFDVIDNLLKGLVLESWDEEESDCFQAMKSILDGVKTNTLWATWVWDSIQLPSGTFYGNLYHFGNFDQCLQVPWTSHPDLRSQYCLVDVTLKQLNNYDGEVVDPYEAADRYIGAKFKEGRRLNTLHLGVCLPAICRPQSITKISRLIFTISHLPFQDVAVDHRDCQVAGAVDKPMGYYVFWFVILSMVSFSVLQYLFGSYIPKSDSTGSKIARCFCLTRNFEALTEVRADEVMMLHGMRTLNNIILIVLHTLYFTIFIAIHNKMDAEREMSESYGILLIHPDLFVDTFIVMSGLLHMKGLLSSENCRPFKTMLQRYIRLLFPLYFLSIVCITYVFPYIGSGPAWPRLARRVSGPCARSWWRNLLMITNTQDDGTHCSEISWSIHTDFHLTIITTAIFMVYRWNKKTGLILCSLAYLTSVVVPALWTYFGALPGLLVYDFGESQDISNNKIYATVYKPFYTRGSAYLIGVALGYLISVYKPQKHRRSMSKMVSILFFVTGASLCVLCLFIGAKLFKKEYSALGSAFMASIDRTIWSIGISFIVISCEYGTLPIINDFLSSKVFVPLSKLTYCNYLLHALLILRNICSLRTPATHDFFTVITVGLGYTLLTYSGSYLVWLFIEAPVTNLINLLFINRNPKKHKPEVNGTNSEGMASSSIYDHFYTRFRNFSLPSFISVMLKGIVTKSEKDL